jgi:hypothetical protein
MRHDHVNSGYKVAVAAEDKSMMYWFEKLMSTGLLIEVELTGSTIKITTTHPDNHVVVKHGDVSNVSVVRHSLLSDNFVEV